MSLSKMFKTNSDVEIKGTPVQYPPNDDGTVPTFYVARMATSNVIYQKALETATRPFRREIQLGTISEKKAGEIDMAVFCDAILTGWQNVPMADVDPAQMELRAEGETHFATFTKENAKKLFERLPELYGDLKMHARNMANFLESNLEAEAKN